MSLRQRDEWFEASSIDAERLRAITAVLEEGRRLQVQGEGGETLEFVLNAATARFLAAGSAQGARLELLASSEPPRPPAQGA